MCRSAEQGGQRCAAHAREALWRALEQRAAAPHDADARDAVEKARADYASTPAGERALAGDYAAAVRRGLAEAEDLAAALRRGRALRERNAAVAAAARGMSARRPSAGSAQEALYEAIERRGRSPHDPDARDAVERARAVYASTSEGERVLSQDYAEAVRRGLPQAEDLAAALRRGRELRERPGGRPGGH